jgi:DNA polymerase III alpha subunit
VLWPEVYRKYSALLQNDLAVVIIGRLELSEDNPPSIIADQVKNIDAAASLSEFLVLCAPQADDFPTVCDSILDVLNAHPGDCDVTLETVTDNGTVVRVKANNALRVKRSNELEEALKKLGCRVRVETQPQRDTKAFY